MRRWRGDGKQGLEGGESAMGRDAATSRPIAFCGHYEPSDCCKFVGLIHWYSHRSIWLPGALSELLDAQERAVGTGLSARW